MEIKIFRVVSLTTFIQGMLLCCTIGLFVRFFWYDSTSGIGVYRALLYDIDVLEREDSLMRQKIVQLTQEVVDWTTGVFELERYAREQLLLGFEGECVYLVTND